MEKITIEKLRELLELSKNAKTGFEKASVFAATEALVTSFKYYNKELVDYAYLLEKIHNVSNSIKVIVGYSASNGHDSSQHAVWAIGDIQILEERLVNNDSQNT